MDGDIDIAVSIPSALIIALREESEIPEWIMKSCINLALSLSRGVFMMYLLIDERFLPDKSSMISCGWKTSSGSPGLISVSFLWFLHHFLYLQETLHQRKGETEGESKSHIKNEKIIKNHSLGHTPSGK